MSEPKIEKTVVSQSEQETQSWAEALGRSLHAGDVVGLEGPLGAGKTCFVRGLLVGRGGMAADVSSPTFVIMQEYPCGVGRTLAHLDAYRVRGAEDMESVGWEEMLAGDTKGDLMVAVEWPSRISESMPELWIEVKIEHLGTRERRLAFCCPAELADRLDGIVRKIESPRHTCPSCGAVIKGNQESFPFCSDRCRMADLNQWFTGGFVIEGE